MGNPKFIIAKKNEVLILPKTAEEIAAIEVLTFRNMKSADDIRRKVQESLLSLGMDSMGATGVLLGRLLSQSHIHQIRFKGGVFSKEIAEIIATSMRREGVNVHSLRLSRCKIDPELYEEKSELDDGPKVGPGATLFRLLHSPTLTHFCLTGMNKISLQLMKMLANDLRSSSIENLDLSENRIYWMNVVQELAEVLPYTGIKVLDLSRNSLDFSCMQELTSGLEGSSVRVFKIAENHKPMAMKNDEWELDKKDVMKELINTVKAGETKLEDIVFDEAAFSPKLVKRAHDALAENRSVIREATTAGRGILYPIGLNPCGFQYVALKKVTEGEAVRHEQSPENVACGDLGSQIFGCAGAGSR